MFTSRRELSVVRSPWSVVGSRTPFNGQRIADSPWRTTDSRPAFGFTLVELLVVITIISILAALITVAAMGALRTARQAAIKAEVTEIGSGFERYKDKAGSYPPNALTDYGPEPINALAKTQILNDLKRHFQQAFPHSQEPPEILQRIVDWTGSAPATGQKLQGGMTAEEAVVFWLGGFGIDPKYPITGAGGPSYDPSNSTTAGNNDPIDSRKFVYPFDVQRLGPRDSQGLFDDSTQRFITYNDPRYPNQNKIRRINFWRYAPSRSEVPYLYFDTSRYTPDKPGADPPARADLHVHALKRIANPADPPANWRIVFANPEKYQILHCGIDGRWGDDLADKSSYAQYFADPAQFLTFPTGPFTGDLADTVVNFVTQARLDDAQTQ